MRMTLAERIRWEIENLMAGTISRHEAEMHLIDLIDEEKEETRVHTLEDVITILKHRK
jgi:hypothetical protein